MKIYIRDWVIVLISTAFFWALYFEVFSDKYFR